MRIVGAHHTGYTVSDLERSLRFYVGLLGCELLWRREASEAPEAFWARMAESELHWFRKWDTVLKSEHPHFEWFVGGKTRSSCRTDSMLVVVEDIVAAPSCGVSVLCTRIPAARQGRPLRILRGVRRCSGKMAGHFGGVAGGGWELKKKSWRG